MTFSESFQTLPNRRIMIVADAHLPLDDRLGAENERRLFCDLLDAHLEGTETVVLLGDTFDYWYEWAYVIPKLAFAILDRLRKLVRAGVKVHYFAGNHDFRFAGFLEKEVGLTIHMDEWIVEIDGHATYFHHGDGLAASDRKYRKMKSVFRNPAVQFLFGNIIHPDLSMYIGRVTSGIGHRRREAHHRGCPPDDEYREAAGKIIARGYDLVIFAHTHRAADMKINKGLYHNPGPFMKEHRYSVIAGDLPRGMIWQ